MKDYDFDYYVTKPWMQEEVGLPENLSSTLSDLMMEAHSFLSSTNDDGLIEALETFPELWTLANTYGAIHPRLVDFEHRHGATPGDRVRHKERIQKIEHFLSCKADPDSNTDYNQRRYEEVASDLAAKEGSVLQPIGSWNMAEPVEEADYQKMSASLSPEHWATVAEAKKERPHAEAERIGRITRDKMLDEEEAEV